MKLRSAFLLFSMLFSLLVTFGQEMRTSSQYPFSSLSVGSELTVTDPLFFGESPGTDYKVDRRFRVELAYTRNNHTDLLSGTKWKLTVGITNSVTSQTETLILENTPDGSTATYAAWADYSGTGTSMNWKITTITPQKWVSGAWSTAALSDLPLQDIHVETMVFNDRLVNLSTSIVPKMSLSSNVLSWDYVPGAVEYDVEWVFIGEYDNFTYDAGIPNGPFDFKEPVRITTFKHQHNLDLIYPKGTLYFRVRPKGYIFRSGAKEIYFNGNWSYIKKAGSGNLSLSITTDFEALKTWQYTVAYAENGMAKSQITYFDGSLRARQQLTQMKSTSQVVAAASLYDYEGRSTIQVIPTPINANSLTYYNQLHRDASGNPYDKADFDVASPAPMGTTVGAGNYYSSANTFTTDPYRERIPDAEGYPFSQVTYINDNTGRPRKSSGVGLTHRMGGTHETVFYYIKPTERDLRELFGSNVGDVSHYDKQVVVDPNGQASVTYTDQFGRTIAAGLSGGNAANLLPLDNNPNGSGSTVTASLMPGNLISTDGNGNLQSVTDYYHLNLGTNSITLTYDLVSGGINSVDDYFGIAGCASCFYEMEIQVFDPTGAQVNLGYTSQSAPGVYPNSIFERYAASSLNCASGNFDPSLSPISHTVSLTLSGEYRIRKVLRVDQQAVAAYLTANAATLPGAPDLSDITDDYMDGIVVTGCGFDCNAYFEQECREDNNYPVSGILSPAQQAVVDACIASKCETTISDVNSNSEPEADQCNMILGTLKLDVSPGGWVYEEYSPWRTTTANWDHNYTLSAGGTFDPTSLQDLTDNWEEQWGDDLVASHPEYCHYLKCTTLAVIKDYIIEINNINSWSDAISGGYITSGGNFIATNDPLNTHAMYSATFGTFITDQNTDYSGTGQNILVAVNNMITSNPDLAEDASGSPLTGADLDNRKWLLMRTLYLGAREVWVEDGYTGCAYLDNESANFVDPDDMIIGGTNAPDYDDTPNAGCADICNNNVSYWISRIEAECNTVTPTQLQTIQGYLQNYCLTDCDGLANEFGAIQVSDLNASNADLMAVQSILSPICSFNLTDLAIDDTCTSPTLDTLTFLDMYPDTLVKYLAVLGSLTANNYYTFITQPSIVAIPSYSTVFPLSYWQSGMSVQLIHTVDLTFASYNISDLNAISIVADTMMAGGYIEFTVVVELNNGNQFQHVINKFCLTKNGGGVRNFIINKYSSKVTRIYSICDDNTDPFEINFSLQDWIDDCIADIQEEATTGAEVYYAHQLEDYLNGLISSFSSSCFGTGMQEQFGITYFKREYAFTLYYYDQAGNLVQTVPPQGVHIVPGSGFNAQGVWLGTEPVHLMKTMYTYNSLNQLVKSETPDGGISKFWYNSTQQLRFSQNAAQAAQNKYSYSKFDALGRTVEAGVFTEATQATVLGSASNNNFPVAGTSPGTYNLYEVMKTYYHKQTLALDAALGWSPKDLNNRIAAVAYFGVITNSTPTYDNAIFYDYDIHGNVKHLLTDLNISELGTQRYKTVDYIYDLYSGKMREAVFQATKEDQFIHRYAYDDDNRITSVVTSRDGVKWDEDASYYYYLHGPLARTELGDDKVQGMDYAYTVHGWLKGVNDNTLTARRDLGKDGASQLGNNRWVARDAFGYSLTYFNNGTTERDYKPIVTPAADANWLAANESVFMPATNGNLYNGNIRAMVTALSDANNASIGTVARVYQYDQLQRIKEAQTWKTSTGNGDVEGNNSWSGALTTTAHYSSYEFDLNGNLTKLQRRGNTQAMDNFTYVYYNNDGGSPSLPKFNNRLAQVSDAPSTDANYTEDVNSGQATDNYQYDAIGRLIKDRQENIYNITWNVQNKVTYIQRDPGSLKSDVAFKYNAMGQRIAKIVYPKSAGGAINYAGIITTYYALDASGNVMATYSQTGNAPTSTKLVDFELYGSARLGTQTADQTLATTPNFAYASKDNRASAIIELKLTTFTNGQTVQYRVGSTVLNTAYTWNTAQTIEQNTLALMKAINTNTVTTDVSASLWWSNNASGTFYMELKYSQPGNWLGQAMSIYVNGSSSAVSGHQPKRVLGYGTSKGTDLYGTKRYELSNHIGNVLAVVSDRKWAMDDGVYNTSTGVRTSTTPDGNPDYYNAKVVAYSDYDPYGTLLDGRHGNETVYRYGYQGSEKDDEIKNISGSSYTTHFRMLDPRIGRWFSMDPVEQPWQSPYTSMDNNPICNNDRLGNVANDGGRKKRNNSHYHDPEKAARKYAKHYGLNGDNSSLTRYDDGSITIQRRDKVAGGYGAKYFKASSLATKRFKAERQAEYEADQAREYSNSHGMLRNFDFNTGIGGRENLAFSEGAASAETRAEWASIRANMAAIDNFVQGCLYTAVAFGTGGSMGMIFGGTGTVSTTSVAAWKGTVTTATGVYRSGKWLANKYWETHGMEGVETAAGELITQVTAQYTENGTFSFGELEWVGLSTAFVTGKNANDVKINIQGVVGSIVNVSYNQGGGTFLDHSAQYNGLSIVIGAAASNGIPYASDAMAGFLQGLLNMTEH